MSRFLRRSFVVAALALVAVPFTAVGSGAQQAPDLTITVKKVVVGPGSPSSVTADCVGNEAATGLVNVVLNFDAQGNPTTSVPSGSGFQIVDGAWVAQGTNGGGGQCDFTETATGGAATTSWTCAYDFDPVEVPQATQIEQPGCAAAAGDGIGPVHVVYPGDQDVLDQASTVTFTNTYVPLTPIQPITQAAQIVAQPAFTG